MSGWTVAFQIFNFLVLVALLRRFLFRPVASVIARRQEQLAREASEADKKTKEAAALHACAEEALRETEAQRERLTRESRERSERACEQMLFDARKEAGAILEKGRRDLEAEGESISDSLFNSALDMAVAVARKLLDQVATQSVAEDFLKRLCEHIDALPADRRGTLREELDGAELLVAIAPAIAAEEAPRWGRVIGERFGGKPARFVCDDSLVAGAELRLPHTRISFCWRDGLRTAREELALRADAR